MSSENEQYAVDDEIATFFTKTPVSREACDSLAKELVGGDSVVPVVVQGACSYTVYAGFFALAWKTPQTVDKAYRDNIAETYENELQILLLALPDRFHPIIRATLRSLPNILALPMVLLHKDFGDCNIMVDEESCHLVGVIDWAEAEMGPFGTNLHSLQDLMSKLHLKNGWIRYEDYDDLVACFWETLDGKVGGLDEDTLKAIKAARVLGLLRSWAFTSRLANQPTPVPIRDDESGRYRMMILEGLLLAPATQFEGLEGWIRAEGREDVRYDNRS
ncbi:aminoglycoside phosphotransferase [Ophiostoma piceae UAMH 11346]|uniref:Aminoglycoside phosphotransferase n=1 Tax=Ophiostoma piceae (strain UAMH 11346) TaxID=1262450 RepID=S3CUG5_OPHP1|nr:aminoglycoside phosphotransferase [Ophiostoma piceae UAMH 11346]